MQNAIRSQESGDGPKVIYDLIVRRLAEQSQQLSTIETKSQILLGAGAAIATAVASVFISQAPSPVVAQALWVAGTLAYLAGLFAGLASYWVQDYDFVDADVVYNSAMGWPEDSVRNYVMRGMLDTLIKNRQPIADKAANAQRLMGCIAAEVVFLLAALLVKGLII